MLAIAMKKIYNCGKLFRKNYFGKIQKRKFDGKRVLNNYFFDEFLCARLLEGCASKYFFGEYVLSSVCNNGFHADNK